MNAVQKAREIDVTARIADSAELAPLNRRPQPQAITSWTGQ